MKKIIAWLLVLTLTAAVSIGATLAYLTDTDEDVNVMTLGKVKIDQLEFERIDDETENEAAKVHDLVIVTFERRQGGLSTTSKTGCVKIPDVADYFDVETISLYTMMRELGIRL